MMPPVILLAGGLGTRLRSITHDHMPKPMVPISYQGGSFPFLEFLLARLYRQGVRKFIICVDHLEEQVEDYFGDGSHLGIDILFDHAGPVMTAARVKHAMRQIDADLVLIHCGDVYHPLSLELFLGHFQKHPGNKMQIAVYTPGLDEEIQSNLGVNSEGQVVSYQEKRIDAERYVLDTGVLAVKRSVLEFISDSPDASLTEHLYPSLISQDTVGVFESGEVFYDIGTPSELLRFNEYVKTEGLQPISSMVKK